MPAWWECNWFALRMRGVVEEIQKRRGRISTLLATPVTWPHCPGNSVAQPKHNNRCNQFSFHLMTNPLLVHNSPEVLRFHRCYHHRRRRRHIVAHCKCIYPHRCTLFPGQAFGMVLFSYKCHCYHILACLFRLQKIITCCKTGVAGREIDERAPRRNEISSYFHG